MLLLKLIAKLAFCLLSVESARILVVVPTPSISHQVTFRPLTQELAKRGHEVVVITTDPAFPKGKAPENLTEIDVHDLSYTIWRQGMFSNARKGKENDLTQQMQLMVQLVTNIFEKQMLTDDVQYVLRKTFDLLMIEACVRPAMSLTHVFKNVPVILMSSFGAVRSILDFAGAPSRPVLLYPTLIRKRLFNLSFLEKIHELYVHYTLEYFFDGHIEEEDKAVRRVFGLDTPSIRELVYNFEMVFLNVNPIWELNRPVPPNVIFIGGLHQKPSKNLPKDLQIYLDSSKNGVIFISFGTNVDSSQLHPEKIQMLIDTFSELPYDILWKWDKDELPNRSQNIRISKWLPQSDLLKHPNIKLFVTQGGLQSTDEAITAGVPLIGIPMLGDQWFNVEQYVYLKIGIRLDLETLTVEKFKEGINTIVNDESYRANVMKLRTIMNDQPQKPLERAVWWTEYVIRHKGTPHLKAFTADKSWSQYLDVELLIVLGISVFAFLIGVGIVVCLLYRFVRRTLLNPNKLKKS